MSTVRPGLIEKSEPDYSRRGDIKECKFDLDNDELDSEIIKQSKIINLAPDSSELDLYTEL
ncbi:MAG: hypothetical protein R6V14_04415 [Halanaerobiales bacterium]